MNNITSSTIRLAIIPSILAAVAGESSCTGTLSRQKEVVTKPNVRPNIIFLLTDDQRDNTLGAMGHPFVRTPNLDRLMKQGARFANTYIAQSVSSPSRVCLFTGMHERKHGVGFSSSYQLSEGQWNQSYPALLRANGYYTGFIGKFGVEYYTFRGKGAEKFDFWRAHDGWTKFFPKDFNEPSCTPYYDAVADIITPIMGENIEKFLKNVKANQPFCLSVSFNVPHGSQTQSMYTGYEKWREMTRPANDEPRLKGNPFYDTLYRNIPIAIPEDCCKDPYQYIPKRVLDQENRVQVYPYNYDPQACREQHIRYYQTISGLDYIIGNMMKSLEDKGLADNTVIIFASDNGLLMGEYGMGGKGLLYDLASKIPCFIYDPYLAKKMRGRKLDNLVSSLDITSTILDYAGIEQPEVMEGSSLVPLIYDQKVKWRDELFLECLFTLQGNPISEGVREGKWKYIRMYAWGKKYLEKDLDFRGREPDFEQMFNLEEDPTEHHNLVDDYKGTELLENLRIKCAEYSAGMNLERNIYMKQHEVVSRK